MPQYDPQRSRSRRTVSDTDPAPVDALLEPHPAVPDLPEGVEVEHVGDELVVHTADADIEIDASRDEVVLHTADADVFVDLTPDPGSVEAVSSGSGPASGRGIAKRLAAVALVAALFALVVVWLRRRRS